MTMVTIIIIFIKTITTEQKGNVIANKKQLGDSYPRLAGNMKKLVHQLVAVCMAIINS